MLTKNKFELFCLRLIPFSFFKFPFKVKIYTNILHMFFGAYEFFAQKRLHKSFIPLIFLMIYGVINSLYLGQWTSIARFGQLFLLIHFAQFLIRRGDTREFINFPRNTLILAFILAIIEYWVQGPVITKIFFGLPIPRINGITGEPNYSSALILALGILCASMKRGRYLILCYILQIVYGGRGSFLALVLFTVLLFLQKYPRLLKTISACLFSLTLLIPVILVVFDYLAPMTLKADVELFSSGRYHAFIYYLKAMPENIFGRGFFHGHNIPSAEVMRLTGLGHVVDATNQEHSLFVQICSEFGPFGYLLFCWFLCRLYVIAAHQSLIILSGYIAILINYTLLNGLTDIALWLIIAGILKNSSQTSFLYIPKALSDIISVFRVKK